MTSVYPGLTCNTVHKMHPQSDCMGKFEGAFGFQIQIDTIGVPTSPFLATYSFILSSTSLVKSNNTTRFHRLVGTIR